MSHDMRTPRLWNTNELEREGDTKGRTAGREENARGRNKNAMFDLVIYPLGGDLS